MSTDEVALRVSNVVKTFGSTTAVNGVSFAARRGEVLALLGPNGAGKTTTIEMCEGFTTPTSGSIDVLGMDPQTEPEKVRERIGIMLQGGGSYSGIRVKEMLNLTASYNADPLDPEWLMDVLGLRSVASTTYRRLSGGQQQRLSLALALIGRPELVFLDEPTAGMDAQSRRTVWRLISALRRDGVTIILTTHLMDEAEELADNVVIVDKGAVIAEGSPNELIAEGASETLEVRTVGSLDVAALPDLQEVEPGLYQLTVAPTPEIIAAVASAAARQGVLISSMGTRRRSLEDVFLDLTGRELRA
ncbi:ABC transporter ATP-binding protein [Corynebacterium genitalium ATCC 33030]|uniref:ABC transporter, ATP-binding protein n=1 Tax=Corynebacterium genitalium ATCC 33030 TaxID=585529 RepID=D7WCN4_9CORY|nr:ABC transporter ATP-binding protein [Corynebacterium genitalium]EFK53915.1 ABC transporter, ATP-binding protein [Corynebacterium genitalium ATCC 33030]UUA88536.1 ABC transporter ATP-binding protein [Corynebacterium genitalium ATCC 33030]